MISLVDAGICPFPHCASEPFPLVAVVEADNSIAWKRVSYTVTMATIYRITQRLGRYHDYLMACIEAATRPVAPTIPDPRHTAHRYARMLRYLDRLRRRGERHRDDTKEGHTTYGRNDDGSD